MPKERGIENLGGDSQLYFFSIEDQLLRFILPRIKLEHQQMSHTSLQVAKSITYALCQWQVERVIISNICHAEASEKQIKQ